jgi:hypothetical protein
MSDFSVKTTTTSDADHRWLRSKHGVDNAVPVTIGRDLLKAGVHYDSNGLVPAGLPLGKLTGQASYGPFDSEATDGRQFLAGFLLEPVQLEADFTGVTSVQLSGAMLVHGIIDPVFVPTRPELTTGTKTTGQFVFVGQDYAAQAA